MRRKVEKYKKLIKRNNIRASPVSEGIKDYDREVYEWLENNYRSLDREKLEIIKERIEKDEEAINAVRKFVEEKWKNEDSDIKKAIISLIEVFELKEHVDKLVILSFHHYDIGIGIESFYYNDRDIERSVRESFSILFNEDIESWLSKEENRKKVVGTVKEFVEENWESGDFVKRDAIASLIGVFELEEHYDKLIELSFDREENVSGRAIKAIEEIGKERFSEENIELVKRRIEENLRSGDSHIKEAVASLIGVFELKEYCDKLIILSFDGVISISNKARESFEKIMGEDLGSWLSKKENREKVVGIVREFVEENWNNIDWVKREAVASLIGIFELKEHVDKLVILSFDGWKDVRERARGSFEKLMGEDVESWLSKGENKEKVINTVKKFIEENWDSEFWWEKETVASLIGFFELEEYYDKLIELSFDGWKDVRERARGSLNKIGVEGFKEYLENLGEEKRIEAKEKFMELGRKNKEVFNELLTDCSPLLVLSVY